MSIHANLNEEAQARLAAQRRNSTISSVVISMLFVFLIFLVLGIFFLEPYIKVSPTIVTYSGKVIKPESIASKKVTTDVKRKPSRPANTASKVIATSVATPTSIPVPDVSPDIPSADFGSGDDFGAGWDGDATGAGGGSMFGSSTSISGALKGRLYDLKQSRKEKKIQYDPSVSFFTKIAETAEKRRFSESAFRDYFQAPTELNLTNLAIPFSSASLGPEYFGAKDSVQPSGWIAVYEGRIAAPETGRYRFRAASDDFLVALVDGRRNLVACWPDIQSVYVGKFKGGEQDGSTKSPLGNAQLHAGEWINLRAGQQIDLTLAIGERPGGMVGFILEVEKEGETYRTAADGRKILPLFTTHPFTDEERTEIQGRFGSYEFEWDNVPVFGMR